MKKKIFFQIFLFLFITVILIIFFQTYFANEKGVSKITKSQQLKIDDSTKNKSNLMYNLKYETNNQEGNNYIISSENGELNPESPDIIYMNNVTATINLKNSTPIIIYADSANYNVFNYDTNFYQNVVILYNEHSISSNKLDLIFKKNLATISDNVVYKNLDTLMQADKIEIDLITKNSTIFMNNDLKKVKIKNIN